MHIQPIIVPAARGFLNEVQAHEPAADADITQTLVWDGNGFASMRVLLDRARASRIAAASPDWRDLTVVDIALDDLAARVGTPDQIEGAPNATFSAVDSANEPWITVEFYKSGDDQFHDALQIMWTVCSALGRGRPI